MYIAFEGIDHCGKTSQINLLKKENNNLKFCREPSNESLIKIIKYHKNKTTDSYKHLFLADRALLYPKIKDILKTKSSIITDRCFISSLVYQDIDIEENLMAHIALKDFIAPDIVYFFDLSKESYIKRAKEDLDTDDVFEENSVETFMEYNKRYKEVLTFLLDKNIIKEVIYIDASDNINNIHSIISRSMRYMNIDEK